MNKINPKIGLFTHDVGRVEWNETHKKVMHTALYQGEYEAGHVVTIEPGILYQ